MGIKLALTVVAVATATTVLATGAHASAPVGSITSPLAGSPATVGAAVTVTATTDGACGPTLQVRAPGGTLVKVATGNPGPMCGQAEFGGSYVPDTPGKHQVILTTDKGTALAETELTAATPPTPAATPTATVTVTATPTPTPAQESQSTSATPTPSPSVTVTVRLTPKATPTKAKPKPTVTRTVTLPPVRTEQRAVPPQVVIQQVPAVTPQALPAPEPTAFPVASAPQVAAPAEEMPAWLAYQLASQRQEQPEISFGTTLAAVLTALLPIAGIGALVAWLVLRKRQRRNRL